MPIKKSKVSVDFLNGNILKALIIFSIPLLISNVFQQMYNTIDVMLVGNILGDNALAAIGASTPIYDLLVGFALGIGNGLAVVVARSYGMGDVERFKRSVAHAIVIGMCIALVITVIAQLGYHPLLVLLNTPSEVMGGAESYISTITLFTVVMLAFNLCSGILSATGNSFVPMVFLMLSAGLNIGLDYLFISTLEFGIRGAAIATVISQGISVVLCVIYIIKKCPMILPEKRHFALERGQVVEMLQQGLSQGLMGCIVSAGSVILQSGINGLGALVIAGHTTARRLFQFCVMPYFSMARAVSTLASQNRGAGNKDRIRKAMWYCTAYNFVVTIFVMIFLGFMASTLVKWVSGSEEAVVLQNGTLYLQVVAPFLFVLGVLSDLRNSLQGMGQKLLPVVSSVIEFFGKILFAILLIPRYEYRAVIFCEPIIWCFMTAYLIYAYYSYMHKSSW